MKGRNADWSSYVYVIQPFCTYHLNPKIIGRQKWILFLTYSIQKGGFG